MLLFSLPAAMKSDFYGMKQASSLALMANLHLLCLHYRVFHSVQFLYTMVRTTSRVELSTNASPRHRGRAGMTHGKQSDNQSEKRCPALTLLALSITLTLLVPLMFLEAVGNVASSPPSPSSVRLGSRSRRTRD